MGLTCPRGYTAISGGAVTGFINLLVSHSAPIKPTGRQRYTPRTWWVAVTNVPIDTDAEDPLPWHPVVNCVNRVRSAPSRQTVSGSPRALKLGAMSHAHGHSHACAGSGERRGSDGRSAGGESQSHEDRPRDQRGDAGRGGGRRRPHRLPRSARRGRPCALRRRRDRARPAGGGVGGAIRWAPANLRLPADRGDRRARQRRHAGRDRRPDRGCGRQSARRSAERQGRGRDRPGSGGVARQRRRDLDSRPRAQGRPEPGGGLASFCGRRARRDRGGGLGGRHSRDRLAGDRPAGEHRDRRC